MRTPPRPTDSVGVFDAATASPGASGGSRPRPAGGRWDDHADSRCDPVSLTSEGVAGAGEYLDRGTSGEELVDVSDGDRMGEAGGSGAAASWCAAVASEVETREGRVDEDHVDDGRVGT